MPVPDECLRCGRVLLGVSVDGAGPLDQAVDGAGASADERGDDEQPREGEHHGEGGELAGESDHEGSVAGRLD